MSKYHTDSPSVSEGNLFGTETLKKGPWTSAEDAILVDYVNRHGEGNWNTIQKYTGLSRCGKSCRLRWANHLRPDLKKGTFTIEEERHIAELHAKMGNKWARMAAELPGRTDNEIKNYWNTRIKRRQRAGLPIYPPDVCLQTMIENQPTQTIGINHIDLFQTATFGIPDVEFNNLELNQGVLSYLPTYFDVSGSGMLTQGTGSFQSNSFMCRTMHPSEVLQQSETMFPGSNGCVSNILPEFRRYADDACERVVRPFRLSSPHEAGLNGIDSTTGIYSGFRASLDGNSSSSMPMSEAAKSELPSLQYSETQLGSWVAPPSPLPSLESVDTFIQSLPTEQTQSQCLSPPNSGLLEAILYESQLKNSKKNLSQQSLSSSAVPGDVVDRSSLKICETEWEEYSDQISPLGHSAASMFSEYNPISGSSPDEPQSVETMPGCRIERENWHSISTQYDKKKEVPNRPDALLGSNWFVRGTERADDRLLLEDALAALQGENMSSDYKEMSALPVTSQGCARGFDTWDSMSSVSDTENH